MRFGAESMIETKNSAPPSPEAVAASDALVVDELCRSFDLIASYATSGFEAARRGDLEEIRLRLRVQLRDCFRHAVELHDRLPPPRARDGGTFVPLRPGCPAPSRKVVRA
jgi:hypothetical protein